MTIEEIDKLVSLRLDEKRYNHTLAVAKLAKELAVHYNVSDEDARTAAILHDITKQESISMQLQMIKKSDIIDINIDEMSTNIFHSISGYLYSRDILLIENDDVLNAIRFHTTGRENMSMLEKIIFTADTVSYDRSYENVSELRKLAFVDLDLCMKKITSFIIADLAVKESAIHLDTIACYNSLCNKKGLYNERKSV